MSLNDLRIEDETTIPPKEGQTDDDDVKNEEEADGVGSDDNAGDKEEGADDSQ